MILDDILCRFSVLVSEEALGFETGLEKLFSVPLVAQGLRCADVLYTGS